MNKFILEENTVIPELLFFGCVCTRKTEQNLDLVVRICSLSLVLVRMPDGFAREKLCSRKL